MLNKSSKIANPSPLSSECSLRSTRSERGGGNLRLTREPKASGKPRARLWAPGFKGLRLTAGRPEKRQCSSCCHDFRNRAAWRFAKNAARNRVAPGLEPIQNYRKHSVFSAVHRKAYQKSSSAGTVEACLLSKFPYLPRLRPPKTFKNTVFLHVLGKIGPTQVTTSPASPASPALSTGRDRCWALLQNRSRDPLLPQGLTEKSDRWQLVRQ